MNDPKVPEDLQVWFEAERRDDGEPDGVRDRVRNRIDVATGIFSGAVAGSLGALRGMEHSATPNAIDGGIGSRWMRLLAHRFTIGSAMFFVGAGVGAGAMHARDNAIRSAEAPSPALHVASVVPVPTAPRLEPAPPISVSPMSAPIEQASHDRPAAAPSPVHDVGRGHDDRLAQERAALDVARSAVVRGRYQSALDAVDDVARRFPQGQLREEERASRSKRSPVPVGAKKRVREPIGSGRDTRRVCSCAS